MPDRLSAVTIGRGVEKPRGLRRTMTGTVLLVNSFDGREMYAEYFRAHTLVVRDVARPEDAIPLLNRGGCDVVVTDMRFLESQFDGAHFIREARSRLDNTVSIIVVTGMVRCEDREEARTAGADRYLVTPALPRAVLYEVKRALLLRRSGRRLEWNWRDETAASSALGADRRRPRAS